MPFLDELDGLLTDLVATITIAKTICKAPKKPPRIIISPQLSESNRPETGDSVDSVDSVISIDSMFERSLSPWTTDE